MSEQDYQRGLRGGNCIDYEGQHYSDWYAGYQEFERQKKDKEFREELEMDKYYSPEEQDERYKKRHAEREVEVARINTQYYEAKKEEKENAYKNAEKSQSFGLNLLFSVISFFGILFGGFILQMVLDWFKIHIPSVVIFGLAIFSIIYIFWESNNRYKKELEEVNRKYGKRD